MAKARAEEEADAERDERLRKAAERRAGGAASRDEGGMGPDFLMRQKREQVMGDGGADGSGLEEALRRRGKQGLQRMADE